MESKEKGIQKPVIPSDLILDRYVVNPILTLLATTGAIRFDMPQLEFFKHIGISGPTLKTHLGLFNLTYQKLLDDHKPTLILKKSQQEALRQLFFRDDGQVKTPELIAQQFPDDILTLLFLYLRDRHLSAENAQLMESFKRKMAILPASMELKTILEMGVNEFEAKPSSQWFKAIVDVLKDVESGKLKAVGDQPDGSRIIHLHISKPNVELFDGKGVMIENFINYAIRQYRSSLKAQKNQ